MDAVSLTPNDFFHSDENFLKLERALSSGIPDDELWDLRVNIYSHLALPSGWARAKKFRFSVFSYLIWLFILRLRSASLCNSTPLPSADFLVIIYGTVSKEFDTLQPLVSALLAREQSVLVLWACEGEMPAEMRAQLQGAHIWQVTGGEPFTAAKALPLGDFLATARVWMRIALRLRELNGVWNAFRLNGEKLLDYLLHLRVWERYAAKKLEKHEFKGVAFVSDTSLPGESLSRLARRRDWPTHHFLHGFPSLAHTRTLATHVHCFSEIDRKFFLSNGWNPKRVHACGHPRQIGLAARINQCRTIAPNQGGLRLLFVGVPSDLGGFDAWHYTETIRTLLHAVKEAQLSPEEFRIRLHPAENVQFFSRLMEKYSPDLCTAELTPRSVAEDLAWANVLVTSYSTMSIEAAYAGCFVIWLAVGSYQYEVREELIAGGYGEKVTNPQEMARLLQRCRDSSERVQLADQMLNAARQLNIISSRAAESTASIMLSTAPNSRSKFENLRP